MKVYIASLSDYNNGRLEGKWFDLSDYLSASDLMDDINNMLKDLTKKYKKIDGEVREEWAVHDYEGIPPTLASEYMGEADFEKLLEIRKVAEDRDIPVEVLVERAGDTGSDDYEALADSLVMVVDGSDETDIVYELEDQLGELGNDFWKDYIFIDDVTERVMYGEDVDRFREDILYENPDMDEDEAERQAEEMADEEADRRRDLSTYLEDMGYGDEIPDFVTKDYNDAWKYALSYDYDVIHHDGEMYVFTNNYSLGGTILSGLVGAYIGYKIGRAKPQKKGFSTEKKIGRKIKGAFSKKKFAGGGGIGFKGLSAKVAKRYEGKKPEAKYRAEYGKRYSKSEAKEVGDKVAGKVYWQQKGRKMAEGGKILQEISTHKAVKKGDKIYIYIKGMPIENAEDKRLAKKYPHWFKDELIRTIPAENEDDLFYIFENYEEENRINLSGYARGGQIGQEIVFDDNGEENTGVIKDITNLGDYVVKADDGRTLLAQRDLDVISLGAMRSASTEAPRKRFGFFEDGGSVSGNQNKRFLDSLDISYKQRILRNIANHYGISIVEAEEEVTDSESENLYEYITDTSLRMKVYNDMKNRRYAQGGGVEKPKYKYYVEWLEDGMLQSEIYNEDEYEQAKELYYQIKYDLFDSQYKRPQIFISDYETGEVVFGDAFEYARGGGVSRFKEGDRVTNKKGKNRGVGFIVKIDSSGMAFVDFEEEGKTEFMSLEDLKKTNQSRYEQGGGVSGIDDLIRG